jgi:protocadherin-16/23
MKKEMFATAEWKRTPYVVPSKGVGYVLKLCLCLIILQIKHGTCQEFTQEFYIAEESAAGTVIGTIGQGSGINQQLVPPPYLSFYNPNEGIDTDLEINANTGEIKIKGRIDRERRNQYKFIAMSANNRNIKVTITVTDINDHAPTFRDDVKLLSLLESTPQDVKHALGSAVDPDLGINTTQRYEIAEGNTNNAFRLGSKRAPDGMLYLDLEINRQLDYEITSSYSLVIKAYDGGTPPKFGTMRVNITIVDANDNQPIFNQSSYSAKIAENATVGTSVLQVFATDRDTGPNGELLYRIDRHRSDPDEQFDINPNTGVVFVKKELDYESKQAYELIVVAQDNGPQKLQATAVVSVAIMDINDNEPVISLNFLTDDGTGNIPETAEPGDFIARISVSDPDLPTYLSQVNVSLEGGEGYFGLTTRDNVVYLVILSRPLDREKHPTYTLTVIATDGGSPPLQAHKSFQVTVADTNDNAPRFKQNTFYADIQEVVPPGSSVIQLTATDSDTGANSQITYKIIHTPATHSDWFQIDNQTGLITTKMHVDCETASQPQLTVVATDAGQPPLSSTATVIVRIRDVNDNQPAFEQSFYNVTVPEDTETSTCILQVRNFVTYLYIYTYNYIIMFQLRRTYVHT